VLYDSPLSSSDHCYKSRRTCRELVDVNVLNPKHELSLTAPNLVGLFLARGYESLFRGLIHCSNPFR